MKLARSDILCRFLSPHAQLANNGAAGEGRRSRSQPGKKSPEQASNERVAA